MSWSVLLAGRYADYDAQVASAIEEAYQRGDAEARVNISGKPYLISFTPSSFAFSQGLMSGSCCCP